MPAQRYAGGNPGRPRLRLPEPSARVIVLANREPLRHERDANGSVKVVRSASGLVTALEPLVESCRGVWVAHGAGTADRSVVDSHDRVGVPAESPLYRLRRVWLDEAEVRGYYYGFANEGLWPLCHAVHVRPVFRSGDFAMYRKVNARFAAAACDEAGTDRPVFLVQDYHYALAPRMIRKHLPRSTVVTFWHIPWPHPRAFEVCPWGRQLIEGLLGSDILGFQTPAACGNFFDTVESVLDADVDRVDGVVKYRGRRTRVRAYPVGVEWPNRFVSDSPSPSDCRNAICDSLHLPRTIRLGVGIDRLDYTKGINEKFLAVERLLDTHPELRGSFVFVQVAEPSRECLQAYKDVRTEILQTASRVNNRYASYGYRPLIVLESHHDAPEVFRFLRAADVCCVSSLDDGMNLVSKEFVCARDDLRGVLVLSRFTGAALQLKAAIQINPYAIDRVAEAFATALRMPEQEQASRMRAMRAVVAEFDTYWWAGRMLEDAAAVLQPADVSATVAERTSEHAFA